MNIAIALPKVLITLVLKNTETMGSEILKRGVRIYIE